MLNQKIHSTEQIFIQRCSIPNEAPFLIYQLGQIIKEPARFLQQLLIKGTALTSLRAYAFDLLSFYRFLFAADLSLNNFSHKHALQFIASLKNHNSPRTINRRIIVLKSFFNSIKQNSGDSIFASFNLNFYKGKKNNALLGPLRIKHSKQSLLKIKVPLTLNLPLQSDTISSFIKLLRSYRDRSIAALMLSLGLRSCEVINLQLHDIDFDNSQILVRGKGNKERLLPISSWIKSELSKYLSLERPLLLNHTACFVVLKGNHIGLPLRLEGLRKIFRYRRLNPLLKKAHPHSFRHTFCTNLIKQKVPLPIVQKLMGHASINTTLIYINLSLQDVANEYHRAMLELQNNYTNEKSI